MVATTAMAVTAATIRRRVTVAVVGRQVAAVGHQVAAVDRRAEGAHPRMTATANPNRRTTGRPTLRGSRP